MNMMKKRANAVVQVLETLLGYLKTTTTLTFKVDGVGQVVLNMKALHPDILTRATFHGMKQRISDAAAIPCDPVTGKPASPAEKFAAIQALVEHYNTGTAEWNRARGEGGVSRTGQTMQAFANVYTDGDVGRAEVMMDKFATKRGIDRKAALKIWAGADKIIDEVARMRAAQPSTVDADELLDELNG